MKFSYTLIKKFVPALKSVDELVNALTMHAFEIESVVGDTIDIKVLPNRYSDAGSHWGMAREVAAILGLSVHLPKVKVQKEKKCGGVTVAVEVPQQSCSRLMVRYFENIKIGSSPEWMQHALVSCGMRPINNLVDITNFVTLVTGQPLHALDFEKMEGGKLLVRFAKNGESVQLLDGSKFNLDTGTMVLADSHDSLDIAGIKGGKKAEITGETKCILLTAANFDGVSVSKASKKYGVITDASVRFAHHLSPTLVEIAIGYATELLAEYCAATVGELIDEKRVNVLPVILKFDHNNFKTLTGLSLSKKEAFGYLKALGFSIKGDMVTAPQERTDIERFEDLVDEIVRLVGYDKLPSIPPQGTLRLSEHDPIVGFKELLRGILVRSGFSEAYNYSFIGEREATEEEKKPGQRVVRIANPTSADFIALRPTLRVNLLKNVSDNFRYVDCVRLFEIGKIFSDEEGGIEETTMLGIVIGEKRAPPFRELKGVVDHILGSLGLIDRCYCPEGNNLVRIESDDHCFGYIHTAGAGVAIAELDVERLMKLVSGEREYEPLPKYPSVMRDMSLLVESGVAIGEILEIIQTTNPALIYDVDLIDEYEDANRLGNNKKSLTFRMVFQSKERTLTDDEVEEMMKKMRDALIGKYGAEVR